MGLLRSFALFFAVIVAAAPEMACCPGDLQIRLPALAAAAEHSCDDMAAMGEPSALEEKGCNGCPDCEAVMASIPAPEKVVLAEDPHTETLLAAPAQYPGFQPLVLSRITGPPDYCRGLATTPLCRHDRLLI